MFHAGSSHSSGLVHMLVHMLVHPLFFSWFNPTPMKITGILTHLHLRRETWRRWTSRAVSETTSIRCKRLRPGRCLPSPAKRWTHVDILYIYTILYYIFHFIILYFIILYFIILYYTILYHVLYSEYYIILIYYLDYIVIVYFIIHIYI